MFADDPDFALTSCYAAKIINGIDDQESLPNLLVDLLEAMAHESVGFVGGYGNSRALTYSTTRAHDIAVIQEEKATYEGGGFLLDPYWARYQAGQSGCFALREVMPDGFEETEYFRYFYARHEICDELIHLTVIPGRGAVMAGVVRTEGEGVFSEEEIARHRSVHPFIAACSSRCSYLLDRGAEDTGPPLASLDAAVEEFGADGLTPREKEVIGLVLYGHNTQSAAAQLGITSDTVKLHRKHAYAKLCVSSQGELFFKFLEHLGLETSE